MSPQLPILIYHEKEKLRLYKKCAQQLKLENFMSMRSRVNFYNIFRIYDTLY